MSVCVSGGDTPFIPPLSPVWPGGEAARGTLTPWLGPRAGVGVLSCVAASGAPYLCELMLESKAVREKARGRG